MNKLKAKKMPLTKVEDTMALKWARTVNRGEEQRYAEKVKALQKAMTRSCLEVDREKATLLKFKAKVQMSSGHLSEGCPRAHLKKKCLSK